MVKPFVRSLVPAYISESESLLQTESLRRALETLRWQSRSRTAGTFCHDGTELTYSMPPQRDAWSQTQIDQWLDKRLEERALDDARRELSVGDMTTEPSLEVRTMERWVDEKKETQFHPPVRLHCAPPPCCRLYPGVPTPSQSPCRAVATAQKRIVIPAPSVDTAPQRKPIVSPYKCCALPETVAPRRTSAKGAEHVPKARTTSRKAAGLERHHKGASGDAKAASKGRTAKNSGGAAQNDECSADKGPKRLGTNMTAPLKESDTKNPKSVHLQSKARRAVMQTAPAHDQALRVRIASRTPVPKVSADQLRKTEQKPRQRTTMKTKQVRVSVPSCSYQPAAGSNHGATHRVQQPQPAPVRAHPAPPRRKVKKRILPSDPTPTDTLGFPSDVTPILPQSHDQFLDSLSDVLPDVFIDDSMLENYIDGVVASDSPAKQEVLRNSLTTADYLDPTDAPQGPDKTTPTNVPPGRDDVSPRAAVPPTNDLPTSSPSRSSARVREEHCTLEGSPKASDGISHDDCSPRVAHSAEKGDMLEHVPNVDDERLVDAYIERAWAEVGGFSIAGEVDLVGHYSNTGLDTPGRGHASVREGVDTAHSSGGGTPCALPFAEAAVSHMSGHSPLRPGGSSSGSRFGAENELPYTTEKVPLHGANKVETSLVSRVETELSYDMACIDARLLESFDEESPSRKDHRADASAEDRTCSDKSPPRCGTCVAASAEDRGGAAARVDAVAPDRGRVCGDEVGVESAGARDTECGAADASKKQCERMIQLEQEKGEEKTPSDEPTFNETLSLSASDMSPTAAIRKYGLTNDLEAVCVTEDALASDFSAPRPVASCLREIDLALAELQQELEKEHFI